MMQTDYRVHTASKEKLMQDVPTEIDCDLAVKCIDNSMMNARIFSGDIVFIKEQAEINTGAVVAVQVYDTIMIRRIYHYNDRIELRPENPTIKVMNFEGEQMSGVKIIGKAVGFMSTTI